MQVQAQPQVFKSMASSLSDMVYVAPKVPINHSPLKACVLDWSGTTADAHVIAPADGFCKVFEKHGVNITMEEARQPMGLRKDLHIAELLYTPSIKERWMKVHQREPDQSDVETLYNDFIPEQVSSLGQHTQLLDGVAETVQRLRQEYDMKVGVSTGFTSPMTNILLRDAEKQGYVPDFHVAGDDIENNLGTRPAPFMIFKNMLGMGAYPVSSVVKVDDTNSGIEEGHNAGCWTVGVYDRSNYTNVNSIEEWNELTPEEQEVRLQNSKNKLIAGGAHYVAPNITYLPDICNDINKRIQNGEKP